MERNNPARKIFEFILAGVGLARKKSKFSSLGQGWQEKSQNFLSWGLSRLAQPYKFSPECTKSMPRWANSLPWWEKSKNFPRRCTPGEENIDFQTRGILVPPFPTKGCLGKKTPGLSWNTYVQARVWRAPRFPTVFQGWGANYLRLVRESQGIRNFWGLKINVEQSRDNLNLPWLLDFHRRFLSCLTKSSISPNFVLSTDKSRQNLDLSLFFILRTEFEWNLDFP